MTTLDEQLKQLNEHHEKVMSHLSDSYKAENDLISNTTAQAKKLFDEGKFQEGTDLMSKLMKESQTHSKARWTQQAAFDQTARKIREMPITYASDASKKSLIHGISNGKLATIVAGVAVVAGGVTLYRHHQQKKRESWASRIEQERTLNPQQVFSR